MSGITQAIAEQIRRDLASQVGKTADRKKIHEALMARLLHFLPDPAVHVEVDEEASTDTQVVVKVRGDFPDSLIQAWKEAGFEVKVQPE